MSDFFFIDDSGSKDWETPYAREFISTPPERNDQNINFWRRNYFVLAGIYISNDVVTKLNPVINKLKIKYFGSKHVEIKSVWLRNPDQRKKHYYDKFDISEDKLLKFSQHWFNLFTKYDIQIQAFVLDKRFYGNKKREEFSPLQMLTQVVFDRVELHPKKECQIIFDQMDREIKTVKHNSGQMLKISHHEISFGSFHKKYSHKEIKFESSKSSNFLQLADSVAYIVYRQFIEYGDDWDNKSIKSPRMYKFFSKISNSFYSKNDRIAGYGIVLVPSTQKIPWGKSTKKPDK